METIRIPRIMQATAKAALCKGKTIGLVPTMGALHKGHMSLVRRARSENDIVVVSVFVNPLQFGPNEDFDQYPRDIERDKELLQHEGADILLIPELKGMYPEGYATRITVQGLSEKLCGAFRPGHFAGVATVVAKIFNIVKPTRTYFGQKDFQQTVVIKRLIEDLNMDIELVIGQTVRESDGLAMSSRNLYLTAPERKAALIIYKTLTEASKMVKSGASRPEEVRSHMHALLKTEPLVAEIQYAGVYDPETLDDLIEYKKRNLLAIAIKIGSTRLIDNMIIE